MLAVRNCPGHSSELPWHKAESEAGLEAGLEAEAESESVPEPEELVGVKRNFHILCVLEEDEVGLRLAHKTAPAVGFGTRGSLSGVDDEWYANLGFVALACEFHVLRQMQMQMQMQV